jgi:hypothetical protein
MNYTLSILDQQRFNLPTAKAVVETIDDLMKLLAQSRSDLIDLLIIRVPTNCLEVVQQLETEGAFLTDTLVYFQKKKVDSYEVDLPVGYAAFSAFEEEAEAVGLVAAQSFKGYFGHYHADPYLDKEDCDAVYSSWAKNSCLKGALADEVILIKKDQEIAAFATIKVKNDTDFEGVLFGVAPNHRGKGLHLNLMQLSENWGRANNKRRLLTSTQITNVTVQKNWCRVGMEPLNSCYTFHLWNKK